MKKVLHKKHAQHLVEFALILPILMVILLVIIEFGYAINTRIAVTEAIKKSLMRVNKYYEYGGTDEQKLETIESAIKKDIYDYLTAHNIPYGGTVTVNISTVAGSQTALVQVAYTYYPAFTLPNILPGDVIPDEFTVNSTQVINAALLKSNFYKSYLTTTNLTSFGEDGTGGDHRRSVIKSPFITYLNPTLEVQERNRVAFLVGFEATPDKYARLFNWWGEDVLPPNLMLDVQTGTLAVRSPYFGVGMWADTGVPYVWILACLGFTDAIYTKMDVNPTPVDYKLDLLSANVTSNLNIPWCSQAGCVNCGTCDGDDSSITVDNLNKRGVSFRTSADAFGALDSITSPTYGKIYGYTFVRSNYSLRVFVPSSTRPIDSFNGLNFTNFDSASEVVVDYYIDSDGDNIPNGWDTHPDFPDVDMDGQLDGMQAALGIVDIVTNIAPIAYPGGVLTPMLIAPPFNFNGTLSDSVKTNIALKAYTPQRASVSGVISGTAFYLYDAATNTIMRKLPNWNVDPAIALTEKSRFMHGTVSGTTISLDSSLEINDLVLNTDGPFAAKNKVTNTP